MSVAPFAEPLFLTQSLELTAQFLGLAALAAVLGAIAATVSQHQYDRLVPREFVLLLGLSSVAVYLTVAGFGGVVAPGTDVDGGIPLALFALAAFLVGAGGALLGRHVGTRFAVDVLDEWDGIAVETQQERNPQSSTTEAPKKQVVTLPERIMESTGYDPVDEEIKAALSGATFEYPQLPPGELEARLERRLQAEYRLAHIDISVAADGTVTEVTVGNRQGGIGKTLPAETTAVAIRADPAPTATPGDRIQVWETDPMRRVVTGELRGIAGDTVTIAIAASDTPRIDPRRTYRLVTLPAAERAPQEFAERLTDAEETYATATVAAGSPLHGLPVGALSIGVIGLTRDDGTTLSLPEAKTRLTPGTELYAIGKPSALRTLQLAGKPLDPSLVPAADKPQTESPDPPQTESSVESQPASNLPAKTESPAIGDVDAPATEQPTESSFGAEATAELDEPAVADSPETGVKGKADSNRFDELKAEFEAEADDEFSSATKSVAEESESTSEPESIAERDESTEDETSGSTFSELKSEFESGEADWAPSTADEESEAKEEQAETVDGSETPAHGTESEADDLVSLEEADISFGDETAEDDSGDDDLSALSFEEDDSGGLFDDDANEGFVFGDSDDTDDDLFDESPEKEDADDEIPSRDDEGDDEAESNDDKADDEDEDDETDDEGGGSTFSQLKEEFESGDADWADDISESPGGDMRLDE